MTQEQTVWMVLGFIAQGLFSARFLVQWIASERRRKSVVPRAFWYFSVAGGALENSNIDTAEQFVYLIEAQRGFQANSRVITVENEVMRDLVNIV